MSGGLTTSQILGCTPFTGPLLPGFGRVHSQWQQPNVTRCAV